jgi:hypothetical protein
MSTRTLAHLQALVRLADIELERNEWGDRTGVFRALLGEAMPYLRNLVFDLRTERERVNEDRYVQGLPDVDEVQS